MIEDKINDFLAAPSDSINFNNIEDLKINDEVKIFWGSEAVGFLCKGENIFSPKVDIISSKIIESDQKIKIISKLQNWIDEKVTDVLKPVKDDLNKIDSSNIRSIIYNLFNFLGTMPIENYQNDVKSLNDENKVSISKLGIRIGAKYFFIPNFLKKTSLELNALLWKVYNQPDMNARYPLPKDGRVSFETETIMPDNYWSAIGYVCIDKFATRVDVFERVFFLARQKIKNGPFLESSDLMNPLGCNSNQLLSLMNFCGYDSITLADDKKIFFLKQKAHKKSEKSSKKNKKITLNKNKVKNKVKNKNNKIKKSKADPNSPFAVLQKLL